MNKQQMAALYADFLLNEGYRPEIDKDKDIVFKADGKTYLIILDESDPVFFRLLFPNFWSIDSEEERRKVVAATDYATSMTKVAKVFTVKNNASASVELFATSPEHVKGVFVRSMNALKAAVDHFAEKMRSG